MKKTLSAPLTGLLAVALLLTGCAASEKKQTLDNAPLLTAVISEATQLKEAVTLLEKKDNRRAMRAFLELKEHATDEKIRAEAVLGAAVALQRLGNISGAIGTLMPAPAEALSEIDARHQALLGELYLRSRAYGTAKYWLQEALEFNDLPDAPWVAAARFNLGKAQIALDDPEDAIIAFEAAAKTFAKLGNPTAAEISASAARRLKSIEKLSVEKK